MLDFIITNSKIIWTILSFIGMVVMFWLTKTFAKKDDVSSMNNKFNTQLNSVKERLTGVEKEIKNLPNKDQLHKLQLEISDLRGDIRKLEPQLDSVGRLSDLLLENKLGEK